MNWKIQSITCDRTGMMCNCIGPQNGEPKCPCLMKAVVIKDGRYIQPAVDLGPVPNNAAHKDQKG